MTEEKRLHSILDENTERVRLINETIHELPFVISIPHSGLYITREMNSKLKDDIILANMDWYLPELYNFLENLGFTVVINNVSRYVIDPNRAIEDSNSEDYSKSLIYKRTTFHKEMYVTELLQEDIDKRICDFYNNYHNTIKRMLEEKLKHFKKVYLIDLHSFGRQIEADVVLGNDNGRTINKDLFQYIAKLFEENGFKVALNNPFSGGFITKHYGSTNQTCETIQIELSYYSYIDKRIFHEEELPHINEKVMENCRLRLQNIFSNIKMISELPPTK